MRAIIGKYKVSIDEMTLICTHPSGISFDLTLDEALGLMKFIKVYQDAIAAAQFDVGLRTKQIDINNKSTSKDLHRTHFGVTWQALQAPPKCQGYGSTLPRYVRNLSPPTHFSKLLSENLALY